MLTSFVSWGSASLVVITGLTASFSPAISANQLPKIENNSPIKNANVRAFLMTIRYAEGTAGPNGYRTMYTGKLFDSFDKHPDINNCAMLGGRNLCSTAAGGYQFLFPTFNSVAQKLNLPDFSPASQDLAAVELLRRVNAYDDVVAGRFDSAVFKSSKEWASLPNQNGVSVYGQPVKSLWELKAEFQKAGGKCL